MRFSQPWSRKSRKRLQARLPNGMNRVIAIIGKVLDRTLAIVVPKSADTKEIRDGMLIAQKAYEQAGLHFGAHVVAITTKGSELYKCSGKNEWLTTFPIWVAGNGKGLKNMVVLPYKDHLELFSKYLQQLVMESLGKVLGLEKAVLKQGLIVLGNKGSTEQHSYAQHLR